MPGTGSRTYAPILFLGRSIRGPVKKLAAKISRSGVANLFGLAGGGSVVTGAWMWQPIAGLVTLGVALALVGWAVDE